MGTDVATGTSTGSPGSTGSSSATPASQPINSGFVPQAPTQQWGAQTSGFGGGLGSMPQASYYMQGLPQSNYYMSDFGGTSNPHNFNRMRWSPTATTGTPGENYGTAAGWTPPSVPTPGANPILLDRARQREARAAAEQAAAAQAAATAAAQKPVNPWNQAGVSPTGYNGVVGTGRVMSWEDSLHPAFNGSLPV